MPEPIGLAKFAHIASRGAFLYPKHVQLMTSRLTSLSQRRFHRDMVFMPPRHGKTELRFKYFPAWYLCNFPSHRVILISASSDFSEGYSLQIRDIIEEFGPGLFGVDIRKDRRSVSNWQIDKHGGGVRALGVGSQIIGRGGNLILIDDPIADEKQALSPATRQGHWDWYLSSVRNRLEPDGIMCFTMQRWHADDLAGMIMRHEPNKWDVLRIPALAEENDVLGRAPGEALWPERYSRQYIEDLRTTGDAAFWFDAQYQGRPRPRDGALFKSSWFEGKLTMTRPPKHARRVRYWDKAGSAGRGDFTVGTRMACHEGMYWVEHVVRGQWQAYDRDRIIRDWAERDNEEFPGNVSTWGEQEPGSGGKESAEAFVRLLAGFAVGTEVSSGSKQARAAPFASQCQAGNVLICDGEWNERWLEELTSFPNGSFDDQVDSAAGAFGKLSKGGAKGSYETDATDRTSHITDHGGGYVT